MAVVLFLYRRFFERLHIKIPYNVLHYYFLKLYNQPYLWHINNSTGYVASAVKRITTSIGHLIFSLWHWYIPDIVSLLLFVFYSLTLSWQLSIYFVVFTTALLGVARLTYGKRIKYLNRQADAFSRFDKVFLDFLYNVKTLKKLFIREYAEEQIQDEKRYLFPKINDVYTYNAFQWSLVDFGTLVMFLLPIGYYFNQVITTGQGIDVIVVIFGAMTVFQSFLGRFLNFMLNIAQNQADFGLLQDKMSGFVSEEPMEGVSPDSWQEITFKNTCYAYVSNNNKYEHSIDSLTVTKGEKVAVIGTSGGGKTTFLNLLTRNIHPERGNIYIGGENLNTISDIFLAQHITYISQDIELFDMSLRENIILGANVSDEKLEKVIQGSCLNELVSRLEGDLDTMIGEKGVKVSAGERQRINIARGLMLQRDIIVLDEITANLDATTAKNIWSFIFSTCKDKTIIAVSHEKTLLDFVDRIIEFRDGKIIF